MPGQLNFYNALDYGAPVLNGTVGSLLNVLDAVLVNGYGTRPAAGWTKPLANAGNCGHYKQGSGNGYHVYINDNGPNASTYKEAYLVGWRTMTSLTAPVGEGRGRCPAPGMNANFAGGCVVVYKSSALSATAQRWTIYADSRTFYLFIGSDTSDDSYQHTFVGDYYSVCRPLEVTNFNIIGQFTENNTARINVATAADATLITSAGGSYSMGPAGSFFGGVTSGRIWDASVNSGAVNVAGSVPYPNPADGKVLLSRIRITDGASYANPVVRGYLRGLWHCCHPFANLPMGMTIQGSGELAGRTFRISPRDVLTSSCWAVETSNTVDSN